MDCIYHNNQELNMTMINQDTTDSELHNSSIYVMLEQMYHFICILMLMYIYTSIVYEIFKNEQTDSLLEVNKTFDLYFETQEIMKENISNLQYKMKKMKKNIQKLKKQIKSNETNKSTPLHEDNA